MDLPQINTLKAITAQLRGPIRAAIPDRMTAYLVDCICAITTRMVTGEELGDSVRATLAAALRDERAGLGAVLGRTEDGRALLAEIDALGDTAAGAAAEALCARVAARLVREGSAEALTLALPIVAAETRNRERLQGHYEALVAAASGTVEREVEPMTAEEQECLLAALRRECGESPALAITAVAALPGGYSKQTIIVTLAGNTVLPAQIVVRRDRAESPMTSTVVDEIDLLRVLYRRGLKVPRPWLVSREVMGTPIIVVDKVAGRNISDVYRVHEKDERYAFALAEQLALLHTTPSEEIPAGVPGRGLDQVAYMREQLDEFEGHWRQVGEPSVTMDTAAAWLRGHLDWAHGDSVLLHRDPRFHNILCDDNGLSALLDWEMAMLGPRERDLGWAYYHVQQMTSWERWLAHYEELAGARCSPRALMFHAMWSDWYCAVQMYRARWLFASGKAAFPYAFAGEEMRQENVLSVALLLRRIMDNGSL